MSDQPIYGPRAEYYDLIYHWKDYPAEAAQVRSLLHEEGIADGSRILEAACGTGQYLAALRAHYRVSGFDLSPSMLAVAQQRLGDVPLFEADMKSFIAPRPVDALLCLFSSIGYLHDDDELTQAMRAFAAALEPGGVLVVQAWFTPDELLDGTVILDTYEDDQLKLARMCDGRVRGGRSILHFHWLVGRPAGGVEHFEDPHELTAFTVDELTSAMKSAGLAVRLDPRDLGNRPGLFVGRKPEKS